ncbi:MAG TPA: hypothetical protein VNG33_08705 [Polyangiaceae bacterium]|nr:hypothetical protein [Polyangiaceae bacterium]
MRLIPIHCDSCLRSALVNQDAVTDGLAACADCGGRARVLPGESYAQEDATLFDDLVAMLRDAGITPLNAAQLAGELQERSYTDPGRGLRRLGQLLPSLGIWELIVASNPASLRKAEGMLALVLNALANGRSRSGFIAAVPPGRGSKTGDGQT